MTTPSATPTDTTSPTAGGAGTATERGWDGWPTSATPDYLVPGMGRVPVSSTAHFRTVVMTDLGGGLSAEQLWRACRTPLLTAVRARDARRVVVRKAVWGGAAGAVSDITDRVREQVRDNRLVVTAGADLAGDTEPAEGKALHVVYARGDLKSDLVVEEGGPVELRGWVRVESARYGTAAHQENVTDTVAALVEVEGATLHATNLNFGDPAPKEVKSLWLEYSVDDVPHSATVPENGSIVLPGELVVLAAEWGWLGAADVDVTEMVAGMVRRGELDFVAGDFDGSAPATEWPEAAGPRTLTVEYQVGDSTHRVSARDGDLIALGTEVPVTGADAVRAEFFEPPPTSVAELVTRITDSGITATDLDPSATESTVEELIEGWRGIAPTERLDPLACDPEAMDEPALGVILHHEQGWYGRGLALGNLLHSVALAPGEVTQIAMTHWSHTTRSTDSETVSQADTTDQTDHQNRAVSEIQDGAISEHQSGGSSAASDTTTDSAATSDTSLHAAYNPFTLSGSVGVSGSSTSKGHTHTIASTVTRSDGSRDVAMAANQDVVAATQRHAEASRTRRATVVREVAQSEDENLTTRVLANYNHMHALTVMYFEVIEVYSLRTRVVDAERVVFLPYRVHDVAQLVPRFRSVLVDAAAAIDRPALALAIAYAGRPPEGSESALGAAGKRLTDIRKHLEDSLDDVVSGDTSFHERATASRTTLEADLAELSRRRTDVMTRVSALGGASAPVAEAGVAVAEAELRSLERATGEARSALAALAADEQRATRQAGAERADLQGRIAVAKARERLVAEAETLIPALESHAQAGPFHDLRLYFNQAVWLALSPGEVLGLARRRDTFQGEPLYERLDPEPVAVTGNYVGYRWRFDDAARLQEFKQQFLRPYSNDPDEDLASVQADIAVPTGGVFGEAVLGSGVSAEKIDLSRFWNWKDSMIPILPTAINPLSAAKPAVQDLSATPSSLDPTSASLGELQALPDPSGLAALSQTMQAQVFRDMSGQQVLQSLAEATTKAAESGSEHAATIASENLKAGLDFVKDMAKTALEVAAAGETGGASLLGGMVSKKEGGGASLLGGVLNSEKDAGRSGLLSKLTGGSGSPAGKAEEAVEEAVEGGADDSPAGEGDDAADPEDADPEEADPQDAPGGGGDPADGPLPTTELEETDR